MKIKLANLYYLNLVENNISNKNRISSLYIRNCPKINNYNIVKSILLTEDNILEEINIDRINVSAGDFNTIYKISRLKGIKYTGEYTVEQVSTPQIDGSYTVSEWILESQKNDLLSRLPNTLTLNFDHLVEDYQYIYLHFTEETPPNIDDLFNFEDKFSEVSTIYVGDGSSYYHDLKIKNDYCRKWGDLYSNKIDLWFVHEKEEQLPSSYKYSPFLLSDGINFIETDSYLDSNINSFLVDVSFVLKSNNGYSLYGNKNSGFIGEEDGLKFIVGNNIYHLENNSSFLISDTETLYELKNNKLYRNLTNISTLSTNNISNGLITLFGDSNSVFVGKIFYIKIINNNSIREFIPCYTNSSSGIIAGLYEIYTNQFYGNNSKFWCPTNENDGIVKRYLSFDIDDYDNILTENGDSIIV